MEFSKCVSASGQSLYRYRPCCYLSESLNPYTVLLHYINASNVLVCIECLQLEIVYRLARQRNKMNLYTIQSTV